MSCTFPKLAFQNLFVKQRIIWTGLNYWADSFKKIPTHLDWKNAPEHEFKGAHWKALKVPCAGCLDCRLKHSRENAIRCVHEASLHKNNCFVTLTYKQESLPSNNTFNFSHPKNFIKKLRNKICISQQCKGNRFNWSTLKDEYTCRGFCSKIKTFGCAEYGDKGGRPHYHLLIFGYDFEDKTKWKMSKNPRMKCMRFRSRILESLWPYGFSESGTVTMQSAGYVARYVVKKNKKKREIEKELSRFHEKAICFSQGIGLEWLKKFHSDVYTTDLLSYKNRKGTYSKMKPPKYYDRKADQLGLIDFQEIKLAREAYSLEHNDSATKQRSLDAQYILKTKQKQLVRQYELEDEINV